eukprot:scaffold546_cov163-Amphora_coffeaeformis.AAC.2
MDISTAVPVNQVRICVSIRYSVGDQTFDKTVWTAGRDVTLGYNPSALFTACSHPQGLSPVSITNECSAWPVLPRVSIYSKCFCHHRFHCKPGGIRISFFIAECIWTFFKFLVRYVVILIGQ